jgi:2-keto-4-pentenoate hydratase/2-oxohepta-3-ene-1,7-dioic acid hydratase in catechol pathway
MRLCTFNLRGEGGEKQRVGVLRGSRVFDLVTSTTMISLLKSGTDPSRLGTEGEGFELDEVVLSAPVPRPGKIIATIVNTRAMLGGPDLVLDRPRLDMKAPSAVVGPGEAVRAPKTGIRPEVELAAVIGRMISKATVAEAKASIFGYTILNDVTSPVDSRDDAYEAYRRDRATGEIRKTTQRGPLFRSKNHDTFCPMGPWVATPEDNSDWSELHMTTKFDDLQVQLGSTSEYIFAPENIAAYVSGFLTLEPGDVVSCGSVGWTPEALGSLDPTEFVLQPRAGTLELDIEGIGKLRNPVSIQSADSRAGGDS